jgi:hypothetical protein
MKTIY